MSCLDVLSGHELLFRRDTPKSLIKAVGSIPESTLSIDPDDQRYLVDLCHRLTTASLVQNLNSAARSPLNVLFLRLIFDIFERFTLQRTSFCNNWTCSLWSNFTGFLFRSAFVQLFHSNHSRAWRMLTEQLPNRSSVA